MRRFFKAICFFSIICSMMMLSFYVSAEEVDRNLNLLVFSEYNEGAMLVRLKLSTDFAAAGLQCSIAFDDNLVSYDSNRIEPIISGFNKENDSVQQSGNTLRILLVGDVKNGTSGDWITLDFKVLNNAVGIAEFKVNYLKIIGTDSNVITPDYINQTIEVDGKIPGDVNDDGVRNIKDLVRLKKYFTMNQNFVIHVEKSDLDKNGSVQTNDMVLLKRLLLVISK